MRTKRSVLLIALSLMLLLLISTLPMSYAAKLKPLPETSASITLNKVDIKNNYAIVTATWEGYEEASYGYLSVMYDPDGLDQIIGQILIENLSADGSYKRAVIYFNEDVVVLPNATLCARIELHKNGGELLSLVYSNYKIVK